MAHTTGLVKSSSETLHVGEMNCSRNWFLQMVDLAGRSDFCVSGSLTEISHLKENGTSCLLFYIYDKV